MDIRAIFMGVGFALMWSSAFTSAKIAVQYVPPFAMLSFRFLISGLLALAIARFLGQRLKLTRAQWIAVVGFGLCQNVIYLGANFWALQFVDASLTVIVASLLPLLVAGINRLRGERLGLVASLGLAAGLVGVLVILGDRLSGGADLTGVAMTIIGLVALTIATLLVQGAAPSGNVISVVGVQMLVGSAGLFVLSAFTETLVVDLQWPLVAAFTYTTLVPGLLATVTWFLLVNRIGTTRAATFHFLNPFFGVTVAAIVLGEALGLRDIFGVAVIMGGILAVQLSKRS